MKYLIFTIIIFFILVNPVLAQENSKIPDWLDQKVISPVEQLFNSMKQKSLEKENQEILKKAQEAIERKQKELLEKTINKGKQESKEMIKNWFQKRVQWIEELMSPLKIKFQEGSDIIRGWVENFRKSFE